MSELPRARVVKGPIGPAPRQVPRRLVLRLLFGIRGIQLGWIFSIVGAFVVFAVQVSRVHYSASTVATITAVADTGRTDDDKELYRVEFDLTDATGAHHAGSFETTDHVDVGPQELRYHPANPSDARLPYGLLARGATTAAGFVFVAAGLLVALGGLRSGRAALRLLRYGEPTTGRIVGKITGRGDDPDQVTLEYRAAGTLRRITRTSHPLVEDDAEEPMLYDVKNPDHAVTLDDLPGKPEIRPDGSLASRPGLGLHVLVLPGVFAVLAVSWLVLLLRS